MAIGHAWKRPPAALALATLTGALLAACGDDHDSDTSSEGGGGEATEVAIGTQPWIGYGPFWIADEQGLQLITGSTSSWSTSRGARDSTPASRAASSRLPTTPLTTVSGSPTPVSSSRPNGWTTSRLSRTRSSRATPISARSRTSRAHKSRSRSLGFGLALQLRADRAGLIFDSIDYTPLPPTKPPPRRFQVASTLPSPTSRTWRRRSKRTRTAKPFSRPVRSRG